MGASSVRGGVLSGGVSCTKTPNRYPRHIFESDESDQSDLSDLSDLSDGAGGAGGPINRVHLATGSNTLFC